MNTYLNLFLLAPLCFLLLISCSPMEKNNEFDSLEWIDLSHAFDHSTPYWPTETGFQMDTVFAGYTEKGYYYSAFAFSGAEHGGTHIDAPIHFAEGKQTVDEIPLENLTGYGVVIDVRSSVEENRDYQIQVSDFEQWEATHGRIPDGAIILLHTGLDQYWPDHEMYLGTDVKGKEGVALLHFPGLHPDAARWLVNERSIHAIGLDTPSIDYGQSTEFMAHRILFEKNIPAFENLANLERLSPSGSYIVALPMKIKGGSGGPLRIIGLNPN